jgi:hypothetical protein
MVARAGDHAPGTAAGTVFNGMFVRPSMGDDDHLAFQCRLAGTPSNFDQGIWSDASGTLQLVARTGQQAPDMAPGVVFKELGDPVVNSTGILAFQATVEGPGISHSNDSGIWMGPPDAPVLVMRAGDSASGAPAGAVFDDVGPSSIGTSIAVGDSGVGVLTAALWNIGSSEHGVWLLSEVFAPQPVLCIGQEFDVDPDPLVTDLRTVSRASARVVDPRSRTVNGLGQCIVAADFTDNSAGVFVFRLADCPADLTTTANPAATGYAVIDGVLDNEDFFFFLQQYADGRLGVADVTTTAMQGQPGYGVPDGQLSSDDFFYYLTLFAGGC